MNFQLDPIDADGTNAIYLLKLKVGENYMFNDSKSAKHYTQMFLFFFGKN